MQKFKFLTNSMEYSEVGVKGSKEYYVTGYISTDEVDRAGEIVTKDCMKDMVKQIKAGNVKLDIEHSTFRAEEPDMPVGKIVDAGLDEKGLWVKCVLNRGHEKFKSMWESIKGGFLDAFSIAYQVKDYAEEFVEDMKIKMLKSVELLNVAITGNPVNPGAKMTESFYKSMNFIDVKDTEVNKMSEQEQVPKEEAEAPKEEVEAKPEEPKVEEAKPEEAEAPKEEAKEERNPLDEIKSLNNVISELKAEIKSLREEVSKPMMKSLGESPIKEHEEKIEVKNTSMLDRI